ncbi:ribonuclease HII [Rhodococcus sp. IEGM 1408]|uniref:ribonuclease HII n=1 Tax=Rhodococcus sp. IEGM 1408 TaxID=3082220 RepID=UPI0029533293|nr:ribonuclease HII [Rhodococcus sp. IEGM 1408]MDV8000458.1 ribonuclease HII [Rhodococcus sp. IEGM 1408]
MNRVGPGRVRVTRREGRLALEAALGRRGLGPVAGVDEAGRGSCAGPLVVAACVLGGRVHPELADLDDSKKLSPATRERLHDVVLRRAAAASVVVIGPDRIDERGVHRCNLEGMRRAVAALDPAPGFVLTDGFAVDGLGCQSTAVIGGDAVVASIAAASVLAKVTRDRIMVELDSRYPGYGFAAHKGYSTASHARAIEQLGPSDIHRMSYANVRRAAQAHSRSSTR